MKNKRNKGITLIALIITIIVILILVGVTINVAMSGGLFTTAKEAKEKTQIEKEKEEIVAMYFGSDLMNLAIGKRGEALGEILGDGEINPEFKKASDKFSDELKKYNYDYDINNMSLTGDSGKGELITNITAPTGNIYILNLTTGGLRLNTSASESADFPTFLIDGDRTIVGYYCGITYFDINNPNTEYDSEYKEIHDKIMQEMNRQQTELGPDKAGNYEDCAYDLMESGDLQLTEKQYLNMYVNYLGKEINLRDTGYNSFYEFSNSEDSNSYTDMIPLKKQDVLSAVEDFDPYLGVDFTNYSLDIVIPEKDLYGITFTRIGDYVFSGLYINTITIPSSITEIDDNALACETINKIIFEGRTSLDGIDLDSNWLGWQGRSYTTDIENGNLILTNIES